MRAAFLRVAFLRYASLRDAFLRAASLRYAFLRDASLRDTFLRYACLRDACLRVAFLRYASLLDAFLRVASLRYAFLRDASLRDTFLRYACLRDAFLRDACLRVAFLRDAFCAMPFSARYLYDGGFFSISSSYRGLSFTNFDSVYFRFDLTLFTFRLLNFVIDIPSYHSPVKVQNTASGILGSELSCFPQESHELAQEYINADDVIAFCLYLMNEMRRNLIKIRSCATFSWFNRFYRLLVIFRSGNVLAFD